MAMTTDQQDQAAEAASKPKRTRKPKAEKAVETPARTTMSDEHKQALAIGREHGRVVRSYIDALDAHQPKRGRKRTAESIEKRLATIEELYTDANVLDRLHMAQEKIDLTAELASLDQGFDMTDLEAAFIEVAAEYSARKGLTREAWRSIGVKPAVLTAAGIR